MNSAQKSVNTNVGLVKLFSGDCGFPRYCAESVFVVEGRKVTCAIHFAIYPTSQTIDTLHIQAAIDPSGNGSVGSLVRPFGWAA